MVIRHLWITRLAAVFSALASLSPPTQAAQATDGAKTLKVLIANGETALDPATASDLSTLSINENIFDPLLRYDYLARPVKLQANTLTAMPAVSDRGTTYVFHIRPGIYFTPDPAFQGRRRELTAQDYVYSFKRLYDPALKSPWLFLFEGKIAGDEKLLQTARSGKFDYAVEVDGLKALDRYTLRIRLAEADNNFLFKLAMPATAAVAREVIEAYPGQAGNHPVGSGPFLLGEWQRSNKIVLLANPDFRETLFQATPGNDPVDRTIAVSLKGKRLPRVDRVEIKVMEEDQGRVLGFLKREFDYLEQVPPPLSGMVLSDGRLKPELAAQGIQLSLFAPLQTYYMWMNMEDPVIGGYSLDRIALRRAIALSYNQAEDIRLLERGLALAAQSPLPPNVLGYDAAHRSSIAYDAGLANALLDHFGYRLRDPDGYRRTPDGQPLTLTMHTLTSTAGRQRDEVWRRSLDAIGIRVEFKGDKKTEIIKASRLGKVQMFETNWIADFPDGENFLQLLYGPNSGRANYARFNLPDYNRAYEAARQIPDSPERQRLYRDMQRLIEAYNPWVVRIHPLSADIWHAWLKNYKRHPVEFTTWRYLDLDLPARDGKMGRSP
ncbi:MAG: ABC transporter substrate-binding protein [Sterolibacterium sp.]|jgi:ABC-type transport system substrate-binding protein